MLGRDPAAALVVGAAAGAFAAHALLALVFPRPWRETWQTVGLAIEAVVVLGNAAMEGFYVGGRLSW